MARSPERQTPGDAREDHAQQAAAQLGVIYAAIEAALIASVAALARKVVTGSTPKAMAVRKLRRTIRAVFAANAPRIRAAIEQAMTDTSRAARESIAHVVPDERRFPGDVSAWAKPLAESLDQASGTAGKSLQDALSDAVSAAKDATPAAEPGEPSVFRKAVSDAIRDTRGGMPQTSLSLSRIQAAQKALDDLGRQGVTGFTDKAGRNWDLASYVEMATRTQVSNAWDDMQAQAMTRAGLDLIETYTHSTEGSCPLCRPWLGKALSLTGETPGYPTLAEAKAAGFRHPNCFPAGVAVSGSNVSAATVRAYEGDLVTIVFADGEEIPVTPNHPVLTLDGWVAAGDIREGSRMLRSPDPKRVLGLVHPDDQQTVARIEDVARTLGEAFPVVADRMPLTAEDFHGDGSGDDYVDVVRADRSAVSDAVAKILNHPTELSLVGASGNALSAERSPFQVFDGPAYATDSIVGGADHLLALFGAGLLPPQLHRLGAAAPLNASLFEHPAYDAARHPMLSGKCLHGPSAKELFGHLGGGRLAPKFPGGLASSPWNVALNEPVPERLFADAAHGRALVDSLSGLVRSDRVVKVRRISNWSGHVYNLETRDGWYFANGIIAHNCRCSWAARGQIIDVTNPVAAAQSAAAYEASQRQRALERKVRAAGRMASAAVTPAARSAARRKLAAARAESAAHRQRHGVVMTKAGAQRREHPVNAH